MNFKRVNKPTARKLYNKGCNIWLLPCKVNEGALQDLNQWIKPHIISISSSEDNINQFDRAVNSYEYYNCNAELGYYSHYYVSEEDYKQFKGGSSNGIKKES